MCDNSKQDDLFEMHYCNVQHLNNKHLKSKLYSCKGSPNFL